MRIFFRLVLIFLSVMLPLRAQTAEIRAAASTSARVNVFNKVDKAFTEKTGITIKYVGDNASQDVYAMAGLLLDGKADFSTTTNHLAKFKQNAEQQGIKHASMNSLTSRLIGRDLMVVFTHRENGVSEMTHGQLARIFNGEAKNWKEFGGADLPIKIVYQGGRPGTVKSFAEVLLKKDKISGDLVKVDEHNEAIEYVSKHRGSVGFVTAEKKPQGVTIIKTEPLGRPIFLMTLGRPRPELETFLKFLAEEGAQLGVGK